ncbi:hypothetical protein [Novosphingobium taihuense]|uniref:Uncharacterized protein n=1 Tax=Novosphingobium taihuense TaxID=260085 RepID=A0A7W7A9L2_9SPHN|nr:hypothetical protein [Novosphingobium taihuense]MBB4612970.1 hypothetical protein [Novosphingobium taihuense]TWH81842.1 hypothetical protein IQ25_03364 [Novosphingobium taihuense]
MAPPASNRRGQPLLALGLLFVGWTAWRIAMWETPTEPEGTSNALLAVADAPPSATPGSTVRRHLTPARRSAAARAPGLRSEAQNSAYVAMPAMPWPQQFVLQANMLKPAHAPAIPPYRQLASTPKPDDEFYEPLVAKDDPRWSGENWVLMRAGSGDAAQAPGAASYGASQAGAIVRYRLGKGEVGSSYAYLRTSLAINAPGQDREVALGFGMRPVRKLPLRVLVEARLQDTKASPMQVRPVATVITELPWRRLPLGFRAEAYGQAGYAGGRGATPFFDAQALLDRPLRGVVPRNNDLRVGAGVWAGGQEGAVRLDAGPRLSFRIEPGRLAGPSRVALDWRFRLAGNARPDSGPAITVTSAF